MSDIKRGGGVTNKFGLLPAVVWLVAAASHAAAVPIDTAIERVVVFRDRAEVTRVGRLELEPAEKREFTFGYMVEYPKDRVVPGF